MSGRQFNKRNFAKRSLADGPLCIERRLSVVGTL